MKLFRRNAVCALLCAVLMSAASPVFAAGLVCQTTVPSLAFRTTTEPTRYIRDQSANILTQIHGAEAGARVGGVGGGEIGFRTEASFEIMQQGAQACIRLKAVDVTLYTKPKIQIANNFSPSSCEYNAVMEHERKHVQALLDFSRRESANAKSHIAGVLRSLRPARGPIPVSRIEQAQNEIQNELYGKVQSYSARLMPQLSSIQQAIDSPQEYARVTAQCRNWDEKLDEKQNGLRRP